MARIVVKSKVDSDGVLHLALPLGNAAANREVQVTVESGAAPVAAQLPTMTAGDLLNSGLVGMWSDRTDINDSQSFARQLRQQAQTRKPNA